MEPQSSANGGVQETRSTGCRLRLGAFGMHLSGRHGIHPEERERGNRFEIDVEIECTSQDAVETDEIQDTVDYREIARIVRHINDRQTFNLIESFAGAIAEELLAKLPMISVTIVRVSKLAPPDLGDIERTMAQVTRCRR